MTETSLIVNHDFEQPLWRKKWSWVVAVVIIFSIMTLARAPIWLILLFPAFSIAAFIKINRRQCHLCGDSIRPKDKKARLKGKNGDLIICKNCMSTRQFACTECGEKMALKDAFVPGYRTLSCPICKKRKKEAQQKADIAKLSSKLSGSFGYRYRDKEFDSGWVNRTIRKSFKQVCNDFPKMLKQDDVKCFVGKKSNIAVVVKGDANDLTVNVGIITKEGISLLGVAGAGLMFGWVGAAVSVVGSATAANNQEKQLKELIQIINYAFDRYPDIV